MYIEQFVHRAIVIHIDSDVSWEDLVRLQKAIDEEAGHHLSQGRYASGFAEYCQKQLEYVRRNRDTYSIQVSHFGYEESEFGYMPGNTTYYMDEYGVPCVDVRDVLRDLDSNSDSDVKLDELESILA